MATGIGSNVSDSAPTGKKPSGVNDMRMMIATSTAKRTILPVEMLDLLIFNYLLLLLSVSGMQRIIIRYDT
jgi:hypothetical protein